MLEGTGALVFDHSNRIVYMNTSKRATLQALDLYMEKFDKHQQGYCGITFPASDRSGKPIYHTNVMLADLDKHLVCCMDSIQDKNARVDIVEACKRNGKELVEISFDEMENFCGNIIQL